MSSKKFIDTTEESVNMYLKEVRKIKMLNSEEELEIAKRIQKGDKEASDILVKANLRFVISIAKDYQGQGLTLLDLISEGNHGLIKAAERFDHTKGFKFISYAVWWVRQSIMQSLNENSRIVRLPVNITNQISKTKKDVLKFEQKNQREVDESDMDLSVLRQPTCTYLSEKINEDGDELIDLIEDDSFVRPDQVKNPEDLLKNQLNNAMSILSERERKIIEMYFGLDGSPMTLDQIGEEFDLTKERIRQIKEKSLRKLRSNSAELTQFSDN